MKYHLTHTDLDGAACEIVVERLCPGEYTHERHNYGNKLDERIIELCQDDGCEELLITDLSPQGEEAIEECKRRKKVRIFDHHATSAWIKDLPGCVWDDKHCAAMLTDAGLTTRDPESKIWWDFLHAVEAWDLWLLNSPSRAEGEDLQLLFLSISYGSFVCNVSSRLNRLVDGLCISPALVSVVDVMRSLMHRDIDNAISHAYPFDLLEEGDDSGVATIYSGPHTSMVAQRLKDCPQFGEFKLFAIINPVIGTVSLRSREDGPDVSVIAKAHGGGGHVHAAGYRIKIDFSRFLP